MTLPPLFAGRSASRITTTPPDEVRRMRKVSQAFFSGVGGIIFGVIMLGFTALFWPLAIIAAISLGAGFDSLKKCAAGKVESKSGNIKKANCPSCNRILNFWIATAFPCPFCKRTLMRQGEYLYDISN